MTFRTYLVEKIRSQNKSFSIWLGKILTGSAATQQKIISLIGNFLNWLSHYSFRILSYDWVSGFYVLSISVTVTLVLVLIILNVFSSLLCIYLYGSYLCKMLFLQKITAKGNRKLIYAFACLLLTLCLFDFLFFFMNKKNLCSPLSFVWS